LAASLARWTRIRPGTLRLRKNLVKPVLPVLLLGILAGCSPGTQTAQAERHYALSGKVVALDPKSRTATVDASAIPNFMDAMTMDYPVKSKADFSKLHVGDRIKASVNVAGDGGYDLSNIQVENAGK
jgi:Cu/Ag efflux protein CusF